MRRVRPVGVLGGVVVLLCLAWCGVACAREPWWHVNTVSAPPSLAGGEGRLVLEVSNVGDAAVDGVGDPVSIVDVLPVGVKPLEVYGDGGGSFPIGVNGVDEIIHCGIVGQRVECSYEGPLLAYERFMIAVTVEVERGAGRGVSEVSVSGGGAASVSRRDGLSLEDVGGFGAENYELTPEEEGGGLDTQAGSHPFQLTSTLTFDNQAVEVGGGHGEVLPEVQPVELAKELRFDLPPGLVGNPVPLPKCPLAVFVKTSSTSQCPDDTAIGVATPILTNTFSGKFVPFAQTVPLYSLEPAVGEPARFGFSTPVGPVVLDTSVRTGEGYGVVVSVPDIPDDIGFVGAQATFWGVPADPRHDTTRGTCLDEYEGSSVRSIKTWEFACPVQEKPQPFVIMPTSCEGALQTSVEGESWEKLGRFSPPKLYTFANEEGEPLAQDGCNRLSFEPSLSVTPDGEDASSPSGLTVGVHVDQEASLNPGGLAQASVRDTTVVLPEGLALNPASADGLSACSLSQISLSNGAEPDCPESAKVGTVSIHTPLLEHDLQGAVYLATPAPNGEPGMNPFNSLLALYIVVKDPVSGVLVKLAGEVQSQEDSGRLVSTFKDTPQLPFEDLSLKFFGGSRAPLGTPAFCGLYTTTASIAPWSGGPSAQLASQFQITSGPDARPVFGSVALRS